MKKVVLIGGGGHCHSVIDAIESTSEYKILGVLDSNDTLKEILGYPVLGNDDMIDELLENENIYFVISVGQILSSKIRKSIASKINIDRFATIISNQSYVSKHATIGSGTVVLHGAIVNANVRIGNHCIINTLANIDHDSQIGNFTHISTGVMINGNCNVGNGCFIASNATLSHGINIADNKIIRAGEFVKASL